MPEDREVIREAAADLRRPAGQEAGGPAGADLRRPGDQEADRPTRVDRLMQAGRLMRAGHPTRVDRLTGAGRRASADAITAAFGLDLTGGIGTAGGGPTE